MSKLLDDVKKAQTAKKKAKLKAVAIKAVLKLKKYKRYAK